MQPGVMRGLFGAALRRVSCSLNLASCQPCSRKYRCAYSLLFESPGPQDRSIMRKYPAVPHPMVLEPPFWQDGQATSRVELGVVLVGEAVDLAPTVALALREAGRMGVGPARHRFSAVECPPGPHAPQGTFTWADLVCEEPSQGPWGIRFVTPTRLISQGRVASPATFSMPLLVRALLSRASLLSAFYGESPLELDFRHFLEWAPSLGCDSTLSFVDLSRYSARQGRETPLGGLVGEVVVHEAVEPLLPFLRLAEIVHVGKATIFGLGKICLERR